MAVITRHNHRNELDTSKPAPTVETRPDETPEAEGPATEARPTGWLAALRLATGFVFLWAFLDKTFGFGYATPKGSGWIDGGSPTEGFLSHLTVGPFADTFNDIAGKGWTDWMFMLGLLGIGAAVMLGVGLRIAAVSGTLLMALMWIAEWPLAKHTPTGEPTMSTNPIVDYHVIYALALIVVAVTYAGNRWGFGRMWARLPFVQRHQSLV